MDIREERWIIGITMRVIEPQNVPERRDAIDQAWFHHLANWFPQSVIVPIPNREETALQLISRLGINRFILSGGNDWGSCKERDATEKCVVQEAVKGGFPVLGVCRGMQVLNVIFGGDIERDLTISSGETHAGNIHEVMLLDRPKFESFSSVTEMSVNSYHRQGVLASGLAKALRPFAMTRGNVVEGIYHPDLPIAGIQWHPERPGPSADFNRRFIQQLFAAATFAQKG